MMRITIIVVLLATMSGCAGIVAGIDADAALKVAADANMQNLKIMVASRVTEFDEDIATAESRFKARLAAVKDGAGAVNEYTKFKAAMVRLEDLKAKDSVNSEKALNTAAWLTAFVDRRIALRAKWDTLLGRLPAISHLKAVAEVEIRQYMNTLNKGMSNE